MECFVKMQIRLNIADCSEAEGPGQILSYYISPARHGAEQIFARAIDCPLRIRLRRSRSFDICFSVFAFGDLLGEVTLSFEFEFFGRLSLLGHTSNNEHLGVILMVYLNVKGRILYTLF